ncbi:hypothetical protein [Streptomyces europaeiscabiei]|uniref:hypothetical protein n=1 Tax=Streptomyces europaeiscabiei TaxID=146819 RepID=UPI003BAD4E22
MAEGPTNSEIGAELFITAGTVKTQTAWASPLGLGVRLDGSGMGSVAMEGARVCRTADTAVLLPRDTMGIMPRPSGSHVSDATTAARHKGVGSAWAARRGNNEGVSTRPRPSGPSSPEPIPSISGTDAFHRIAGPRPASSAPTPPRHMVSRGASRTPSGRAPIRSPIRCHGRPGEVLDGGEKLSLKRASHRLHDTRRGEGDRGQQGRRHDLLHVTPMPPRPRATEHRAPGTAHPQVPPTLPTDSHWTAPAA